MIFFKYLNFFILSFSETFNKYIDHIHYNFQTLVLILQHWF